MGENRKIEFWDCDDGAELLNYQDIDEALESHLDSEVFEAQQDGDPLPSEVIVYGYAPMKIAAPTEKDADNFLRDFLEGHHEDYQGEDGIEPTDAMTQAAFAFLKVLHAEWVPWMCEVVETKTVNVAAWIAEHRPDWLEPKKAEVQSDG